jgi:2-isopropylmalate synthase
MIQVLDATLREGEQTPGVYFDMHIKLAIARLLDEIGIDIIEAGHPRVTPEIHASVKTIAERGLHAVVGAHARSIRTDIDLALDCGVGFIGIFYCVSDERLNGVFKKDLETAIGQICESIEYARKQAPELLIRYTPEDTVRSSFTNVVRAAIAAVQAGADIISVADTTGHMVPGTERNMYDYVTRLKQAFEQAGLAPRIAVHCHNDRGLALANALDAYRAGAEIIDATVLGLGERAGVVDLAQLLTVLTADFGIRKWNLEKLPELYDLVSKYSGVAISVTAPVVGKNAFCHCAGVHTHAATINPMHYESLSPELVGRSRIFALDHMSGIASVRYALHLLGITAGDRDFETSILEEVKAVGKRGRTIDLEELAEIVEFHREHELR